MEQNRKINEVLQLLSQAWLVYARNFPDGKNYDIILAAIQEAQMAAFEEDTPG